MRPSLDSPATLRPWISDIDSDIDSDNNNDNAGRRSLRLVLKFVALPVAGHLANLTIAQP
jgi:hypothetical protein